MIVAFKDWTLFIVIGNFKIELWVQLMFNLHYLKIHLVPTSELIIQSGVHGIIFNMNFLIINSGLSLQLMNEEQKQEALKEINDTESSD